jgi:ferritin-like metal-binding protein YciE
MSLGNLKDLLVEEVKDLYSAEKQLVKALPKMAKAATNAELKQGFVTHLEETEGQVERLEEIFKLLGLAPRAKHCDAMEGLIDEGASVIAEEAEASVKDAALIGAAQKVEHYEIAAYGTARTHAQLLGMQEAMELLEETLEEEKATDQKLTALAESQINFQANRQEASSPGMSAR